MFENYGLARSDVIKGACRISDKLSEGDTELKRLVEAVGAMLEQIQNARFRPVANELEFEEQLHRLLSDVLKKQGIEVGLLVRHGKDQEGRNQ